MSTPATATLSASLIQNLCRPTRFILHRRRAGKIAHLPSPVREQINIMLQDGLPYADIIATLGETGKHLNKDNLSRWRKADHQDWLREQVRLKATKDLPEPSPDVKDLTMLLHDFDSDTLRAALSRRRASTTLARVVNSVVRMVATADKYSCPPGVSLSSGGEGQGEEAFANRTLLHGH